MELTNMRKQQKTLVSICVWSSIILFIIRCLWSWKSILNGVSVYTLYGYASEAISVDAVLLYFYEKFLWKINPFEHTPKLAKRYTGTLRSNYGNIERKATLEIKQTLLSIHVTLITDQSKSESISASIDEIVGEMKLTYCYLNTPKSAYRKQSEIHYGTATFSLRDPRNLEGQYYTDRQTIGDMSFKAQKKCIFCNRQ